MLPRGFSMSYRIWCLFGIFAGHLSSATADSFPVAEYSVNWFEPDLETGQGFSTAFLNDGSAFEEQILPLQVQGEVEDPIFGDTYFDLGTESQGEDADWLEFPPDSTVIDHTDDQSLVFGNLDGSALASSTSSCGTQDSSGSLPDDSDLVADLFSGTYLDARGFFEDVDQLNEVTNPNTGRTCTSPVRPPGIKRPYRPKSPNPPPLPDAEPEKTVVSYPVDQFGECPALWPEYRVPLCCAGPEYDPYVMRCAFATISFFCGHEVNHYCCKDYMEYDLIGVECIRVAWPVGDARPWPLDDPYTGEPPYPNVQDDYRRTPLKKVHEDDEDEE